MAHEGNKNFFHADIHIQSNQPQCRETLRISQRTSHILNRMFSVHGDPQILSFHDNAVSSRYVSIHGIRVPHNRRRIWRARRTLRVLLTGYIAVVTLSPVWRRINEWHASTFCWNICDREISGTFPDNFCAPDQIFIRTVKPGKQYCCVWFFNKLGHAFVKGVKQRALRRLLSIIKSSENIWQLTKQHLPTFFFFFLKYKVPGFHRHINKFTVLDAKAKMQIFTSWSRWVQRWFSLNTCLLRMHTTNRDVFYVFNFWCMLPKKSHARVFSCFRSHVSELGKKVEFGHMPVCAHKQYELNN